MNHETAGRAGNATHCPECGHALTRKASSVSAKRDDGAELISLVCPVPGAEAMHADFLARVADGSRKLATGRKRAQRKREDRDDYAWRQAEPTLERFLAHCEVAGRILRRYALPGGTGQRLELPAFPGSLEVGEVLEVTADEIRARAHEIAGAAVLTAA